MKHLAKLTLATTLVTALGAPVFAGGLSEPVAEPTIAPVVYQATRADGDWGGFYAGGQLGYADIDTNGAGSDGDGAIGGVHAGYRMDYGSYVGGVELDYDTSNIDLDTAGDKLDSIARLKLMLGADLGRTLIYGTAGVAHAKATVGGNDLSDNGYFLGVGLDYALTRNWVVGGELVKHKFDNFDNSGTDLDATTAKVKVSYRF
ncbi:MAG: porin family protein [Paracoccaceae bacterium]|nr:porin family protein [Paracoccaceae bacterium]